MNNDVQKSCEIATNRYQKGEGTSLTSQGLSETNHSQHELSGTTWVKRTQFLRNTALETVVRKIHFHGPILFYKDWINRKSFIKRLPGPGAPQWLSSWMAGTRPLVPPQQQQQKMWGGAQKFQTQLDSLVIFPKLLKIIVHLKICFQGRERNIHQ